jgi:hypothetical protein
MMAENVKRRFYRHDFEKARRAKWCVPQGIAAAANARQAFGAQAGIRVLFFAADGKDAMASSGEPFDKPHSGEGRRSREKKPQLPAPYFSGISFRIPTLRSHGLFLASWLRTRMRDFPRQSSSAF